MQTTGKPVPEILKQRAAHKEGQLSIRQKVLFSTGDLSTSIPQTIIMFFQLFFLTDVAGLRPDYAAWAIAIGRLWDAINDPLFGQISDRIRSKYGRRRVVLLYCSVPLGISFALMWWVPPLPPLGLIAYYALLFMIFDSFFTFIHVSYNSLTPELTQDYDERSSLNGFRMVYSIGGGLLSIILATVLGWVITDRRVLFTIVGVSLGAISIIPPFIVFAVTHEPNSDTLPEPMPTRDAIRETFRNRAFWIVMGLYLFSWTTASILAAVLVYFANYYLRVPAQSNYFVLVSQVFAIAFIPLWVWVAQKLDKRRAFMLGMVTWVLVLVGIALVRPDQVVLAYILAALSGSGIATAYVLPWAMVPDIIELDELRTGQRREGSYYAFTSFFQKLGTGMALWVMGQVLAATGYVTPVQGQPLPAQPAAAVQAIRWMMGGVPVVLLAVAILLAWRFPITRESHQAVRDALAARISGD
jgi:glycoside/pentoside/hexuronide:cation symporter, GPH family